MNPRLGVALGALIALLVLGSQVVRSQVLADVLILKSGKKVEGRITNESEMIVTISTETSTGKAERMIPRSDISGVTRSEPLAPAKTPEPESSKPADLSSVSPDKKWKFVDDEERPRILEAGTKHLVLEISEGRGGVVWAPDSKRFGFNYHISGSRGYSFSSVAFYELRGDNWEEIGSPADDVSRGSQLMQLFKGHLPKKFNPRDCSSDTDVLDLREWTDSSTAILYAPCYGRNSGKVKDAFLFTLKFDEAGNWKIIKTHRMSEKEVEEHE